MEKILKLAFSRGHNFFRFQCICPKCPNERVKNYHNQCKLKRVLKKTIKLFYHSKQSWHFNILLRESSNQFQNYESWFISQNLNLLFVFKKKNQESSNLLCRASICPLLYCYKNIFKLWIFKIRSFGISCWSWGYLRKVQTNQLLIWQIYLHMENSNEEFCLFHGCWPSWFLLKHVRILPVPQDQLERRLFWPGRPLLKLWQKPTKQWSMGWLLLETAKFLMNEFWYKKATELKLGFVICSQIMLAHWIS